MMDIINNKTMHLASICTWVCDITACDCGYCMRTIRVDNQHKLHLPRFNFQSVVYHPKYLFALCLYYDQFVDMQITSLVRVHDNTEHIKNMQDAHSLCSNFNNDSDGHLIKVLELHPHPHRC